MADLPPRHAALFPAPKHGLGATIHGAISNPLSGSPKMRQNRSILCLDYVPEIGPRELLINGPRLAGDPGGGILARPPPILPALFPGHKQA